MTIGRTCLFVIKTSKYCNLRCDYCYEFSHLGDKTRMSLDNLGALFANIENSSKDLALAKAEFIWHGGEPFLIPIEFYQQVEQIQKETFGIGFPYMNAVQTNLTVLTEQHIEFLKRGFFRDIGVSFDVYGDQRIDTKGRLRTDTVLANLQKLIDHHICFGAIAVLAQNTLPAIKHIYRFYDGLHINHRVLAYYRTASGEQALRHGLTYDELVRAFKDLFNEWLASERATPVSPIDDYVRYAVRHVTAAEADYFDRSEMEHVFIIDVNGDVYSHAEAYVAEFCYGNLYHSPLSEIVVSESRHRSIMLSQERMRRFCHDCLYFGHCPGEFVSEATYEERKLLETRGCPVRPLLDHIIDVFQRTDIMDSILQTHSAQTKAQEHPALSVG